MEPSSIVDGVIVVAAGACLLSCAALVFRGAMRFQLAKREANRASSQLQRAALLALIAGLLVGGLSWRGGPLAVLLMGAFAVIPIGFGAVGVGLIGGLAGMISGALLEATGRREPVDAVAVAVAIGALACIVALFVDAL